METTTVVLPRPTWNVLQYICVCFGLLGSYAAQMFPYMLYRSGGAAYLLPYIFFVLLLIPPLLFLQLRLGGAIQKNVIEIFSRYFPLMKGIGVAAMIIITMFAIYYHIILGHYLFYMGSCLKEEYPWSSCDNVWNTKSCTINNNDAVASNISDDSFYYKRSAAEEFMNYHIGVSNAETLTPTPVRPMSALMLFIAWVFTFIVIGFGPAVFGWVLCGVVPLMVICLFITLIYGWFHFKASATEALKYFYFPSTEHIGRSKTWLDAASLPLSMAAFLGIYPTIGKYGGPRPIITAIGVILPVLIFLFIPHLFVQTVSPYLGAAATEKGVPFPEIMTGGLSFIIVSMADSFAVSNTTHFVAFAFYATVYLFGATSVALASMVVINCIVDAICDDLKKFIHHRRRLHLCVSACFCTTCFLLGLPMTTQNGMGLLTLLDVYIYALVFIIMIAMAVALAISFIRCSQINRVTKLVATPIFAVTSLICVAMSIARRAEWKFMDHYYIHGYNAGILVLAWLVAVGPLILGFVLGVLHSILTAKGSCSQRLSFLCQGEQEPVYYPPTTIGMETVDTPRYQ